MSRIVSHYFEIPGVKPSNQVTVESGESGEQHQIYRWTPPLATPSLADSIGDFKLYKEDMTITRFQDSLLRKFHDFTEFCA